MKQIKIGLWPALSIHAAITEWEKLRDARSTGHDVALDKRTARQEMKAAAALEAQEQQQQVYTVRKVCEEYWQGHIVRNRKQDCHKPIQRVFRRIPANIADAPAASVTRAQAFQMIESFLGAPSLARRLRAELGAAWEYAQDAGRLPDTVPNWWRLIMRNKIKSVGKKINGKAIGVVKRALTESEIGILIPWLSNFKTREADVLTMYLWTCTRGAEIVTMEAKEISEEADGLWWTIPKAKTKNARYPHATDLRVPLVGRAKQIVQTRLAQYKTGYLFPSDIRKSHVLQKQVQQAVYFRQPYCTIAPQDQRLRLPVSHWSPHDLRRSSRTLLASMGCPQEIAEAVLGHMQPGIIGVYNRHCYDKERLHWLTKLDVKLEQLVMQEAEPLKLAA